MKLVDTWKTKKHFQEEFLNRSMAEKQVPPLEPNFFVFFWKNMIDNYLNDEFFHEKKFSDTRNSEQQVGSFGNQVEFE